MTKTKGTKKRSKRELAIRIMCWILAFLMFGGVAYMAVIFIINALA